ncbi:MAG: hypothetical protein ACYCZR_07140 [Burkholderiales bacterium]
MISTLAASSTVSSCQSTREYRSVLLEPTSPAASSDTVILSDTSRRMLDDDAWKTALADRPQLVNVDSAIAGGLRGVQSHLQQILDKHGLDGNAQFKLGYDAASQTFSVNGPSDVKQVLEAELNAVPPTASAAAIKKGYTKLDDLASSAAAVRKQYALDKAAGGYDAPSRQSGFAYRFSLERQAQGLVCLLTP